MIIGIILAAGKGSRMEIKSQNKTVINFRGKPLVGYGIESYKNVADKTLVVLGHKSESVKEALVGEDVLFVEQKKRLGTGHAVKKACEFIERNNLNPEIVLVGNGDNMVFHSAQLIKNLIKAHVRSNSSITVLTILSDDVKNLDNGRIIKNMDGNIEKIVEKSQANEGEIKIKELNVGFYCFSYSFLKKNINKIKKNKISGEYQITELIEIANKQNLTVSSFSSKTEALGLGVNTREQLNRLASYYV